MVRINSNAKGKRNERRVASLYKQAFADAARNYQPSGAATDGADIRGVPFWVEAKSYAKISHAEFIKWIDSLSGNLPGILHVKLDKKEPLVVIKESDWVEILKRVQSDKDRRGPWADWAQQ